VSGAQPVANARYDFTEDVAAEVRLEIAEHLALDEDAARV